MNVEETIMNLDNLSDSALNEEILQDILQVLENIYFLLERLNKYIDIIVPFLAVLLICFLAYTILSYFIKY